MFGVCYEFSKEINVEKIRKIGKIEKIMGKIEILISIALMTINERFVCSRKRLHKFRGVAHFLRQKPTFTESR